MLQLIRRSFKLAKILAFPSLWHGLRFGVAATIEHRNSLKSLPCATVIDVGANKGQFALLANLLWRTAHIHSFEPHPAALQVLRKVARVDSSRIHVYPLALGDRAMVSTLHVASRADSSSLLPLSDKQSEVFGVVEIAQIEIDVSRLDDMGLKIERPCLLKIDVQGFEYEVLKGAAKTLSLVDYVYVELSRVAFYERQHLGDSIDNLMSDCGFYRVGSYNITRSRCGEILQEDALYVKRRPWEIV